MLDYFFPDMRLRNTMEKEELECPDADMPLQVVETYPARIALIHATREDLIHVSDQ